MKSESERVCVPPWVRQSVGKEEGSTPQASLEKGGREGKIHREGAYSACNRDVVDPIFHRTSYEKRKE